MTINLKNLFYLLLVSFIQFPIRINGYEYLTYIIIYGIPLIYSLMNIGRLNSIWLKVRKSYLAISLVIIMYLFIVSFLWPLIYCSYDFTFITDFWRRTGLLLLKNLFLFLVYIRIYKNNLSIENYFNFYIKAVMLYVVFTFSIIFLPEIREHIINIVYLTPKNLMDLQDPSYFTRIGWIGWSGFNETMHCTVAVLLCCSFIIFYNNNKYKQLKYLLYSLVLIVGNMFYGRSGLTISAFALVYVYCFMLKKLKIKFIIVTSLIMFAFLFGIIVLKDYSESANMWYNWVFSAFINFYQSGRFRDSTGSVSMLIDNMYWMPPIDTFLFGDGRFTGDDGTYYMHTDSGIMRAILFYGVINYFLYFIAGSVVLQKVTKKFSGLFMKKNLVFALFFLAAIAFEVKGNALEKIIILVLPMYFIVGDDSNGKCNNEYL